MAGLVPKEAAYGDKTALRRLGMKDSPVSGTPTIFKPQGGRPPEAGAAPKAVPLGGEREALPPAPGIPPEEQSLYDRSANLAAAAQAWAAFAASPLATEKVKRIALALKEAARLAVIEAREGSPFDPGL